MSECANPYPMGVNGFTCIACGFWSMTWSRSGAFLFRREWEQQWAEWVKKNLRGTENTFAADKNNIGVFLIKTRRQASWNTECVFLVCCQLTIKNMLFITLPSNLEKLSTRTIFKNKPRKPLLQGFKSLFANIVMDNTQHAFFGFKRYSRNILITATPSEGASRIV